MIKRMNKRGQSGEGLGTLVKLIVLLVVAGLIIWFVYKFFYAAGGYIDKSKVDVTAITEKCNTAASANVQTAYCNDEILIAKDRYINCEYAKIVYGADISPENQVLDCGSPLAESRICLKIRDENPDKFNEDKVFVNSESCAVIFDSNNPLAFRAGNGGGGVVETQNSYLSCNEEEICAKVDGVANNDIKITLGYLRCKGVIEGNDCGVAN